MLLGCGGVALLYNKSLFNFADPLINILPFAVVGVRADG